MKITKKLGDMGIPGFRTGKLWKMALASLGYFFIFMFILGIIGAILSPIPPEPPSKVPTPTISEPIVASPTPTMPESAATPLPTPSEPLITKAPSEMALTIDDMPDKWARLEEPYYYKSETYEDYSVTFTREMFGKDWLDCAIRSHSNISDAKECFDVEKARLAEKYKIKSVGIGDESFGWAYGCQSEVVFRKANIYVEILFESKYGKPDIEHAKNFAEIVEKKFV